MKAWKTAVLATLVLVAWPMPEASAQELTSVFRKVAPSVVVIRAEGRDVGTGGLTRFSETGSGVLISTDGKVMTAAHVVHSADKVTVEVLGGEKVNARVVASEPAADLSLLQVEAMPKSAKVAPMGDSDRTAVGEQVIVVGAPYGLSHSLSVGWISSRYAPNTVYGVFPLAEFLQTTATINQGNSGGPLFNLAGEVIGIVSHNISKSGGSEGLGFVVSINSARELLLQKRSLWSGLDGSVITGELAEIFNVPQPVGYLVKTVAKGSIGWDMGILGGDRTAKIGGQDVVVRGDIILAVAGISVDGKDALARIRTAVNRMTPGEPLTVKVLRAGRIIELTGKVQ